MQICTEFPKEKHNNRERKGFYIFEALNFTGDILPGVLKEAAFFMLFFAAAWTDWHVRRVPNRLLAVGVCLRLLLFLQELCLSGRAEAVRELLQAAAGSLILLAFFLLAARLSGRGLGMGDIKFIGTAALFTGAHRMLMILFCGLMLALGASFVLLARAKRAGTGNEGRAALPLIPFLLGGLLLERLLL